MDTGLLIGILTIVAGIILNIILVAYGYGQTKADVKAARDEIADLKKTLNNGYRCKYHDELLKIVAKNEGKLEAELEHP
jgi:hypothetical protein